MKNSPVSLLKGNDMTKNDKKKILLALKLAIDYEESYIDSHCVQYAKGKESYKKAMLVPKQYRHIVRTSKRNIEAWKKLIEKMVERKMPPVKEA